MQTPRFRLDITFRSTLIRVCAVKNLAWVIYVLPYRKALNFEFRQQFEIFPVSRCLEIFWYSWRLSVFVDRNGSGHNFSYELRHQIIRLRGFWPSLTRTGLYSHRRDLEAWKFIFHEVESMYNPCSENKDAGQLCSYCTADLRLCFRICNKQFFFHDGSISS